MGRTLPWLEPNTPLPDPRFALEDPPGLLAASAQLSTSRLLEAYSNGIFPWYSEGEPVLWWSPSPRTVLKTDAFHASHSLAKRLRQIARHQAANDFSRGLVTVDQAFDAVLAGCALTGDRARATWITPEMERAYRQWHQAGYVHSIETWIDAKLVGGLYGVSLGRMFFGESMFSQADDASKIALAHLVTFLRQEGVAFIDCQMHTEHLARLGATAMTREAFVAHVRHAVHEPPVPWGGTWITPDGLLKKDLPIALKIDRTDP